jgi:hypothetical protein
MPTISSSKLLFCLLFVLFAAFLSLLPMMVQARVRLPVDMGCFAQQIDLAQAFFAAPIGVSYPNGYLRLDLQLSDNKTLMDGRSWTPLINVYDNNCGRFTGIGSEDSNIALPAGTSHFSIRFTTPTRYQIWSNELEQPIQCPLCSYEFPPDDHYTTPLGFSFTGLDRQSGGLIVTPVYPTTAQVRRY